MLSAANNAKCVTCGKVFCCLKCRYRHEKKMHCKILSCPICYGDNKIVLKNDINTSLLNHIAEKHFPLHCIKCAKIFENGNEIMSDVTKCVPEMCVKSNISSVVVTPITNLQLQINNQILTHNSCKNVSLLKNVSLINHSSQSTRTESILNGKIVRTTSTPMQEILRNKENAFDGSGSHVSSIYAGGSESESDAYCSPPIMSSLAHTSVKKKQISGRMANINKKAVTPLRHVVSKNFRRAIMEEYSNSIKLSKNSIYNGSPLDLRTSPALRRIQSEIIERNGSSFGTFNSSKTSTRKSFSISSVKKTTESILIKSTTKSASLLPEKSTDQSKSSTMFTTCQSIEIIRSTELNEIFQKENRNKHSSEDLFLHTPKVGGAIKKKTINFKSPATYLETDVIDDDDEVFYTPKSTTTISKISSSNSNHINQPTFSPNKNSLKSSNIICDKKVLNNENYGSKFWSGISSLIRISSFGKQDKKEQKAPSFIRRCASFAGYLSKTNEKIDIGQTLKRKRNFSIDDNNYSYLPVNNQLEDEMSAKRLKRIHGRKPIERMRNTSYD